MIKAIHLPSAVIGTISSRSKNNGVSFRVATPELNSEERNVLFDLQDQVVDLLIQPKESDFPEIVEVKGELDKLKTPGARLRATLFVLWKKRGQEGTFESFYATNMEKFIDRIKLSIDSEAQ